MGLGLALGGAGRRVIKYLIYRTVRLDDSSHRIARGCACGIAVSFTPLFGLHFFLAVVIAWAIRGNIAAALLGTFAGNPLTFPLMWAITYPSGLFLLSLVFISGESTVDIQAFWFDFVTWEGFFGVF